jgi:hypothetical protein
MILNVHGRIERKTVPGKYSHLKGQLTSFSGEPEYQDRVNSKKEEIIKILQDQEKKVTTSNLGALMVESRIEKARLESLVKEENLIIAALDQMLVERMESESYTSLKLSNNISLTIKDDVYCTVKDKPKFHSWIRSTGQEDLFSVNYQTMSSMTKTNLIDGDPIPPGIDVYFKQSIQVRGVKNLEQE